MPTNESISYNCQKLKCSGLICGCFSRDRIVRIKNEDRVRPVIIFHMNKLHQLFPDFDFSDADDLAASEVANDSTQSSY